MSGKIGDLTAAVQHLEDWWVKGNPHSDTARAVNEILAELRRLSAAPQIQGASRAAQAITKMVDMWLEKMNLPTSNAQGKRIFTQTIQDIIEQYHVSAYPAGAHARCPDCQSTNLKWTAPYMFCVECQRQHLADSPADFAQFFSSPSAPTAIHGTRFDEFDDPGHPANKWWEKHGQYMLSGGGRREFIWACRGWIAREQLAEGVAVTGDSLCEKRPIQAAPAGLEESALSPSAQPTGEAGSERFNQMPTPEKPLSSACIVNLHDDCPGNGQWPLPLVEAGTVSPTRTAKCACDCHTAERVSSPRSAEAQRALMKDMSEHPRLVEVFRHLRDGEPFYACGVIFDILAALPGQPSPAPEPLCANPECGHTKRSHKFENTQRGDICRNCRCNQWVEPNELCPSQPSEGLEQVRIDISNLDFYSRMADEHNWNTGIIHKGVIVQTLKEISQRLARHFSGGKGAEYSVSYEFLHQLWQAVGGVPQGVDAIQQGCYGKCRDAYLAINRIFDRRTDAALSGSAQEPGSDKGR